MGRVCAQVPVVKGPSSIKCLFRLLRSWGCLSAVDRDGRTIWIADAHCSDGKRFVVRADEKLTAFMELESATRNERFTAAHG
jgi:hypothetical protein